MVCGSNFVDCQLALGIRGVCVGAFLCVSSTLVAFNLNCLHGYNSVCAAQVCDANMALLVWLYCKSPWCILEVLNFDEWDNCWPNTSNSMCNKLCASWSSRWAAGPMKSGSPWTKKAAFNMELLVCLNIVCVCFLMLSQIRWAHTSIAHLVCRRTVVFKLWCIPSVACVHDSN